MQSEASPARSTACMKNWTVEFALMAFESCVCTPDGFCVALEMAVVQELFV